MCNLINDLKSNTSIQSVIFTESYRFHGYKNAKNIVRDISA